MRETQTVTPTSTSTKVGIAVAIVMLAAALATVGPKMVSSFAAGVATSGTNATSTPAFNCTDTDGGKIFDVKGTVTVDNFSITDSCKNATTLNEAWCDPVRKYANNVEQTCANGCRDGSCLSALLGSSSSNSLIPTDIVDVRMVGTKAYLLSSQKGLYIIDASKPNDLKILGSYTSSYVSGVQFQDLQVDGNYAYYRRRGGATTIRDAVVVVNVSNAASPSLVKNFEPIPVTVARVMIGHYTINSGKMYVIVDESGARSAKVSGVYIFDITNPASPIKLGAYQPDINSTNLYHIYGDLEASGQNIYIVMTKDKNSGPSSSVLQIVNVSSSTTPILKSEVEMYSDADINHINDMVLYKNYIYTRTTTLFDSAEPLKIINVANPSSPVVKDFPLENKNAHPVSVSGNYLVQSSVANQPRVNNYEFYDITNPLKPVLKKQLPVTNPIYGGVFNISSGYVLGYVVSGYNLEIYKSLL